MDDDSDENPWGEAPDWAQSDSEQSSITDNQGASNSNRNGRSSVKIGTPLQIPGAQHLIILIDSHPSMFEPCIRSTRDDVEERYISPFDAAMIAAEKIIHHKVHYTATTRTGKRDGVGIVLFNCPAFPDGENDLNRSVRRLMPLSPPGVDNIHTIRSCCKVESYGINRARRDLKNELYSIKTEYNSDVVDRGHYEVNQAYSLRSAFFEANDMFNEAKCVKKLSSTSKDVEDNKVIWIFTNESDPSEGNKELKASVQCAVKDLSENSIGTRLWILPRADKRKFDRSLFYDHIITEDEYERDHEVMDRNEIGWVNSPIENDLDLDGLLEKVSEVFLRVRKLNTIPMYLPDWKERHKHPDVENDDENDKLKSGNNSTNPEMMIDLYHTIRIQKKPLPITINSTTKRRTLRVTEILSADTGEIISGDRIRYYFEFGNERIYFTKDEVDQIKINANENHMHPGLYMIGFKSLPSISSFLQYPLISRPIFAYPNEELVKGTRTAFATLHESMLRKQVLGIGTLLQKITGIARMVAIIPQEESLFESGEQEKPPGFILIPLAYEDDIRAVPENGNTVADMKFVEAAENMVRNLNLDRDFVIGESFENPALRTFWNYIESVALGTPLSENDDDTSWDVANIISACGPQIDAFRSLLPEDKTITTQKKRKATPVNTEMTNIDWVNAYKQNTLDNFTANELKCYLRSYGDQVTGRKSDLLARVKRRIATAIQNDIEGNKL